MSAHNPQAAGWLLEGFPFKGSKWVIATVI